MIRGAVFDLDGTLLDSMDLWAHLGERYLLSVGVTPKARLGRSLQSMTLPEAARLFRDDYGLTMTEPEIAAGIQDLISSAYRLQLQPKHGVPGFLCAMQQHGVAMCVATASSRDLVEAALARCGLLDYFCGILTCDELGCSKRTPLIYEKALELLGTDKAETVVFEDADHAAQTAKQAGFPLAGVYDSFQRNPEALQTISDFYIRDFSLPESLSQFFA